MKPYRSIGDREIVVAEVIVESLALVPLDLEVTVGVKRMKLTEKVHKSFFNLLKI